MTNIALYDKHIDALRRLERGLIQERWIDANLRVDILKTMLELPLLKVWKGISELYPEVDYHGRPFIANAGVLYVYQHKLAATDRVAFLVMKYTVSSTEGVRWILGAPESPDYNILRSGLNHPMMQGQEESLGIALEKACKSYRV